MKRICQKESAGIFENSPIKDRKPSYGSFLIPKSYHKRKAKRPRKLSRVFLNRTLDNNSSADTIQVGKGYDEFYEMIYKARNKNNQTKIFNNHKNKLMSIRKVRNPSQIFEESLRNYDNRNHNGSIGSVLRLSQKPSIIESQDKIRNNMHNFKQRRIASKSPSIVKALGRNKYHLDFTVKKSPKEEPETITDIISKLTKDLMKNSKRDNLNNLFNLPYEQRGTMIQRKISSLTKIYEDFYTNLPSAIKSDLNEIIRHLQRCVEEETYDYEDICQTFVITPVGTIFKPLAKMSSKSHKMIGEGLLISITNEITKADFSLGIVRRGIMQRLYKDGEFFSGNCLDKGVRHGQAKVKYPNGDTYEGEYFKDERAGIAKMIFNDGSEYFGEFSGNEISGNGTLIDSEGNEFTTKLFENDKKVNLRGRFEGRYLFGLGKAKYKNGNVYSGYFKKSKKDGKGEMKFKISENPEDPDDVGDYNGHFKSDRREGEGTMYYTNNYIFEGVWKKDKPHNGTLVTPEKDEYIGKFYNVKLIGKGKFIHSYGNTIEGIFSRGEFPKTGTITFQDGNIFEGNLNTYQIGKEGKMKYLDGSIYEGEFTSQRREGFGVLVTPQGDRYKGQWSYDTKHGKGIEYIYELQEIYEGEFRNGKRHGKGTLITPDKRIKVCRWINGIIEGSPKKLKDLSMQKYKQKYTKIFSSEKPNVPKVVIHS
ncbi:unnamed protein product [Moneuplotes crassus]|uniref:Phosphatidylinositol-4-phosphate 5-kinase n=1 Tax=Euplotes crassus TaxID=5936 RepID=A0AAD1Y9K2_EUPCR|nr:unnamed protein product [Moneuplotes crassus]